jgi:hypothetical protein
MRESRRNRPGLSLAAAALAATGLACDVSEWTDRAKWAESMTEWAEWIGWTPSATPAPQGDESLAPAAPVMAPIDLGSKRKTVLVEAFYPVPLTPKTAEAKLESD